MKNGLGYSALVAVALLLALGLVADTSEAFAIAPSRIHRQASNTATASTATKLYASNNSKSIGIQTTTCTKKTDDWSCRMTQICSSALLAATLLLSTCTIPTAAFAAEDLSAGATSSANAKITTGGASTLQSGRTIAITRGVNLDRSDFSNQNLKGVAFQQSIVRDVNFKNCNLVSSSFFDATVDGSNFENADLTQANFEMAQFKRASLKNAIVREMYVSGSTLFEGIKDIENTDWTDTYLRKDQQKYLCAHPTAKGTNPKTGVDTRESLMCID